MKAALFMPALLALGFAQQSSPGSDGSDGTDTGPPSQSGSQPGSPQTPVDPDDPRTGGGSGGSGGSGSASGGMNDPDDDDSTGSPSSNSSSSSSSGGSGNTIDFDADDAEAFGDDAVKLTIEAGSDGQVEFTLVCDGEDAAWCSVGHGGDGQMSGSTVYICWADPSGQVYLSQREATEYAMPEHSSEQTFTEIALETSASYYGCKFSVDPNDSTIRTFPVDEEHGFIWAFNGSDVPDGRADADIQKHDQAGALPLTVSEGGTVSSTDGTTSVDTGAANGVGSGIALSVVAAMAYFAL